MNFLQHLQAIVVVEIIELDVMMNAEDISMDNGDAKNCNLHVTTRVLP